MFKSVVLMALLLIVAACTPANSTPPNVRTLQREQGTLTLTYPAAWAAASSNRTNLLLGSSAALVEDPPDLFTVLHPDEFIVNVLLAVPQDIQYPVSAEDAASLERMTALNLAAASRELGREAQPVLVQAGAYQGTRATFELRDQDVTILLFQFARGDFYVSLFARTARGGWSQIEADVLEMVATFNFERR